MIGNPWVRTISLCALAVSTTCSLDASADDGPHYSWIGAQYARISIDVGPITVDGSSPMLGFSASVADNFRILGGYSRADLDYGIDTSGWQLGVGYVGKLTSRLDWTADLSWVRAKAEAGGISESDSGYGASVGVRGMALPKLELGASIDYVDYGGSQGSDTSLSAEVLYYVTDVVGIGAGLETSSDITAYGIGVRYDFGK